MGSNIDAERHLRRAAALLRTAWPDAHFSHVYVSPAHLRTDQPDFLNAVCRIETDEEPDALHRSLRAMEESLGKNPPFRFGPRTIDLDLLLYEDRVLPDRKTWGTDDERLTIPHPRMHERRFVLAPLMELTDPEDTHPVIGTNWSSLSAAVRNQQCEKTDIIL